MARNYKPNDAGLRALLLGPEVRSVLRAQATKAMAVAQADAASFADTGQYAASFQVTDTTTTIRGFPRAAARLENTSDHAAAVEWGYHGRQGSASTSAHRTLGRALDSLRTP